MQICHAKVDFQNVEVRRQESTTIRKKTIELYKELGSISAMHRKMKGISYGSVYGIIRG